MKKRQAEDPEVPEWTDQHRDYREEADPRANDAADGL
jgi:hypothetical protein